MICAGIDIGADSIRLILKDEGVVYDEPCTAAIDSRGNALAIGEKALEMQGSDEEVKVVFPFHKDPVDFEALNALLEELCYEFKVFKFFQKTILLVSYPTELPDSISGLLKDNLLKLGAYRVYFEQEIWISAIGAGLDLMLPIASCVMNIGYSNCDIALFSQGKMIRKASCTINGRAVSEIIKAWLKMEFNLNVSYHTLDAIKRSLGNTIIQTHPLAMEIRGLDAATRTLKTVVIDENQIAPLLAPLQRDLGKWILSFIEELPEAYRQDIKMRGIVCCGGTMKIKGLACGLRTLIGHPVFVTDDPVNTVSSGIEILMERLEEL